MSASSSETLISWIEGTFPMGEALAIGGQLAGGLPFHHGATTEFTGCMDAELWSALGEALNDVATLDCDASRSAWVFENTILWIATRPDGGWIGVFTPRDLSAEARGTLQTRLEQFVALT